MRELDRESIPSRTTNSVLRTGVLPATLTLTPQARSAAIFDTTGLLCERLEQKPRKTFKKRCYATRARPAARGVGATHAMDDAGTAHDVTTTTTTACDSLPERRAREPLPFYRDMEVLPPLTSLCEGRQSNSLLINV